MTTLKDLNEASDQRAHASLERCCGAKRWVDGMLASRPWRNAEALYRAGETVWATMERDDILEAFTHHPQIGADLAALREKFQTTAAWSGSEQSAVTEASEEVLIALRDGNRAYRDKFGYIFIVCATGKSASEMLELLNARLGNESELELSIAAAEQAKITRLRLEKLLA